MPVPTLMPVPDVASAIPLQRCTRARSTEQTISQFLIVQKAPPRKAGLLLPKDYYFLSGFGCADVASPGWPDGRSVLGGVGVAFGVPVPVAPLGVPFLSGFG